MKHKIKDFTPLISIFVVVIGLTWFFSYQSDNHTFMNCMRLFMGFFFIIFGLFKTLKWKAFVKAYKEYDVIAMKSTAYAYLYPLIEIGLGAAYLYSWNLFYVNLITLIVMTVSAYGVWLKLKKKEEIPCACLGMVFKLPMTKVTLFEDLLMVIMALVMLLV